MRNQQPSRKDEKAPADQIHKNKTPNFAINKLNLQSHQLK